MLENLRSELVWRTMRRNPHIVRGLTRAGFTGGWLDSLPGHDTPPPRTHGGPAPAGRGAAAPAAQPASGPRETLRFWAMGREGEVVQELVRDFEAENPGVRVRVQQIPWTAAHEKLLTAHVGRSTPDLAQLGNTWIAEFAALRALEPLDPYLAHSTTLDSTSYFPGIWDTNRIDAQIYGVPWYVDTRVLFYRKDLLARAGYDSIPGTWDEWKQAMHAVQRAAGPDRYAVFLPLNEWPPPVILGLQAGSPLLIEDATRGAFSAPQFQHAFGFYLSLFRDGLAPPINNTEISNLYQEFARGYFSMYITGPWNVGEFRRRLPPELQDDWGTARLPGPTAPGVSLAGGSSLVLFRRSQHKPAAWALVEFLSRPEQQDRFRRLTGNLPARVEAWSDSALASDPHLHAFREQLQRVVSTPKLPEWELIATRLQERVERAARGGASPDSLLRELDRDVDRILEKRRWMHSRERPVEVAR
jgi:multiple sugar transport system substrate-binding protein